jgi:uncharacterized protein
MMSLGDSLVTAARPAFHLAIPVDDLAKAETFYGGVLGLPRGRSADAWIDWNFAGHQVVTHLVEGSRSDPASYDPAGNPLEFKAFADESQLFKH